MSSFSVFLLENRRFSESTVSSQRERTESFRLGKTEVIRVASPFFVYDLPIFCTYFFHFRSENIVEQHGLKRRLNGVSLGQNKKTSTFFAKHAIF